MNRTTANALLLLAGAIWGMGFVAQQSAMDSIGPYTFVALRFLIATIVVLPFAWRESRYPKQPLPAFEPVHLLQFIAIGVCLFAGMAAQQIALLTITVTDSGFLTGVYVVLTPFLAVALFRQWPHPVVWPAAALSLFGIVLLSGGRPGDLSTGHVLTLFGALCWAMQVVLIAQYVGRSNRPLALSEVQFAVTCLLASVVALLLEPINIEGLREAAPEILYAGIFATGFAFSLQVIGQRYTTASQAAIFLSSEALFAALFGALFRGDRIGALGILGCGLIFTGMLLVELVPHWRNRHARSGAVN